MMSAWMPGDLVWAKLSSWPWWPAVVMADKNGKHVNQNAVHVVFIDKPSTTAWIKQQLVTKFSSSTECLRGGKICDDSKSQKRLYFAQKADVLVGMSREDCLFKVSFITELKPMHVILDKLPVTNVEPSPNEDWHLHITDDENDNESRDSSSFSVVNHDKSSCVQDDSLDEQEVLSSTCDNERSVKKVCKSQSASSSSECIKPKKRSNIVQDDVVKSKRPSGIYSAMSYSRVCASADDGKVNNDELASSAVTNSEIPSNVNSPALKGILRRPSASAVGSQGNFSYPADSEIIRRRRDALVGDILRPVMSELATQRQLIADSFSQLSATITSMHADIMSVVRGAQYEARLASTLPPSPCSPFVVPSAERVRQRSSFSDVTHPQSQLVMNGFGNKKPSDPRLAAIDKNSKMSR